MYPYYGHYYSHEDYVSDPFQNQAYDPGFIDERLIGPMGPPSSPPPSFVPAQTQQVGTFAIDQAALEDVYSDLR